jgi:hypothetical protein
MSNLELNQGNRVISVIDFWTITARQHFVNWSIVMVGNPVVVAKVQAFFLHPASCNCFSISIIWPCGMNSKKIILLILKKVMSAVYHP